MYFANMRVTILQIASLLLAVSILPYACERSEGSWTSKLGEELWHLSKLVTKHADIVSKYRTINARVEELNGTVLLDQTVKNIAKMLQRRMDAVKCIMEAAEERAEFLDLNETLRLDYYNMKFSSAEGGTYIPQVPWEMDNLTSYLNMSLSRDRHFFNIPVNTEYSAVHIPTNLYDRYPDVAEAIMWSESLDDVFINNYQADPGLSWQYFGASSGMMRQYPAMQWRQEHVDLYDCRTRPWFIEAATCTKDIIVLMDTSGSMTGMRNTIAKLVVDNLLDTFGNNDFINVYNFSWTAGPLVDCFNNTLVQATPENLKIFHDRVAEVKPEGNASFPHAFTSAFELLRNVREARGCENTTDCNQAIMLVTDGLPGNITDVFEEYNMMENSSIPVRVFTYLVGREVRGVQEIQLMACENRGYYVHIHNVDEARDQVLKYIPVIARPLVLQGEEHPVVWTHVFADVSDPKVSSWLWEVMQSDEAAERLQKHLDIKSEYFSQQREDGKYVTLITQVEGEEQHIEHQEYQLMSSVSVPVFDKREHNGSFAARLLGIAGTDVPIRHIHSLSYPYKIGAGGYAFIVSNNGYLIMHPDLRPVYQGLLKLNYNSVDLAQVEFADEPLGEAQYDEAILKLREAMVERNTDEVLEVDVKFHYDDMRRVGVEKRDYHVGPLWGTPFALGLAIPSGYGKYVIGVGDEVLKNFQRGIHSEKDFEDKEWRIHPDWTYCKYRFPSHHKFQSPEEELLHFLERMKPHSWEWQEQYPDLADWAGPVDNYWETEAAQSYECSEAKMEEDSFYCEKDLIQLLIFDSRVMEPFKNSKLTRNSFEEKKLKTYNATLRFVATQSGLTRWQQIPKPANQSSSDFGDAFPRAIDEAWYKAAVLQHQIDKDSFVFSVPFNAAELDNPQVTATLAIFPKDGGREAPAAVVGYQMTQESLLARVIELTSKTDEFTESCSSDSRACYLLDHNAYTLVSLESSNVTGLFFGLLEPDVMRELVDLNFYREIVVFDYQGLCIKTVAVSSDGSFMSTPYLLVKQALEWLVGDLLYTMFQSLFHQLYTLDMVHSNPLDSSGEFEVDYSNEIDEDAEVNITKKDDEDLPWKATVMMERQSSPCDKKITLYYMEQNSFTAGIYPQDHGNFSRLHFAQRVPHTNLALIVLNTLAPPDGDVAPLSTDPEVLTEIEDCHRMHLHDLPNQRLGNCFTYHPLESEIEACGRGHLGELSFVLLVITSTMSLINNFLDR